MAFKTGGYKTKLIKEYGSYLHEEYTIYCAIESVTNTCVYKMFDDKGKERDIVIGAEFDADDNGKYSLIDCLYHLKHKTNFKDIVIEEMSREEMANIFGR